jgi:hypothetical protein
MRGIIGTLALLVSLALATPAWAQKSLGGHSINPQQIVNVPIDLSKSVVPALPPPTQRPFSLTNFFSRMHIPGQPSRFGVSAFPAPSVFPSTQYPNALQPLPTYPVKK